MKVVSGSQAMADADAGLPRWLAGKVRLIAIDQKCDERGALTPVEFKDLPFEARRLFFVTSSHSGAVRGKHGHRTGIRLLLCVSGEIAVEMRIGENVQTVTLRPDGIGLLVEAGVWMQETYSSGESVLAVLTDLRFEEEQYADEP